MTTLTLDFSEINCFSRIFTDYTGKADTLRNFYDHFPEPGNFEKQIKKTVFPKEKRQTLHSVLQKQYRNLSITEQVKNNIDALKESNTYCITTGHQLNIFTGPLYCIYKIITVIRTAEKLKQAYPDHHFVPVFWMASEDHDFEEISDFFLFNKKYVWQTDQQGAVGRFSTGGMATLFSEIKEKLPLFEGAYLQQPDLASATRYLYNGLFGSSGLVILDGDDSALKKQFVSCMKEDLLESSAERIIKETSEALKQAGYEAQINPRPVNLFYLDKGIRARIIREGENFSALNTDLRFSKDELIKLLGESPEKFSPNVALRPLYQESVLPGLAYVGGPAEIGYWLQLKALFRHFNIPFPILMPRLSSLVLDKVSINKMQKLNLKVEEIFYSAEQLKDKLVSDSSGGNADLSGECKELERIFEKIKAKAMITDPSLEGYIASNLKKMLNDFSEIEKKLRKAGERKAEEKINQMLSLKEKLFPGGVLQERRDNFLNFYINDPEFINKIMKEVEPFDFKFYIFS